MRNSGIHSLCERRAPTTDQRAAAPGAPRALPALVCSVHASWEMVWGWSHVWAGVRLQSGPWSVNGTLGRLAVGTEEGGRGVRRPLGASVSKRSDVYRSPFTF